MTGPGKNKHGQKLCAKGTEQFQRTGEKRVGVDAAKKHKKSGVR